MENKKKVLLLSDSLGLPRDKPQFVSYYQTYFNLLKEEFSEYEFIQASFGGATIEELVRQSAYFSIIEPTIVIIQTGIVDCSPRSITKFEIELIKRIPLLSNFISRTVRKYSKSLRDIRKISYTNSKDFRHNLNKLKSVFENSATFFISILPASDAYEIKVPGIKKQVRIYNAIIKATANEGYIETNEFSTDDIMTDYHHLNKHGHHKLYQLLREKLKALSK